MQIFVSFLATSHYSEFRPVGHAFVDFPKRSYLDLDTVKDSKALILKHLNQDRPENYTNCVFTCLNILHTVWQLNGEPELSGFEYVLTNTKT